MSDLWDGETQAKTRRRVPRFKVGPSLAISVSLPDKTKKTFTAATFSPLGLGFFGAQDDASLAQLKNTTIQIQMDKFKFDLKANIQYCVRSEKIRRRDILACNF